MNNEIEDQVQIIGDAQSSIKTYKSQQVIKNKLVAKYQVYQHFKNIEDLFLDKVIEKTKGVPLFAFWFAFQSVIDGFVQIKDYKLESTTKFRNSVRLGTWNGLALPHLVFKKNCETIEKALQIGSLGLGKLDGLAILQMIQLLQTASVVGDVFSSRLVDCVNECPVDPSKKYSTMVLLKELEDRDLLEMVYDGYDSDGVKQCFFRFNHIFLRETLLHMQSFTNQKK